MPDPANNQPQAEKEPLTGAKRVIEIVQLVLGISGGITALVSLQKQSQGLLLIGVFVLVLSAAWYFVQRRLKRRRRRNIEPFGIPSVSGAYLRGLLPFEQGEQILGRARDIRQSLAKITSSEFRFGYISGEAGVGKTSLLRAGIIPEIKKSGWIVLHVLRLGNDPRKAIAKAIQLELGTGPEANENTSIHDLIVRVKDRNPNKRILIICDQFEEFFISHRTAGAREPFLKEIGESFVDTNLPVAFLISLRKEFVDDLQDFRTYIPQPLDTRFSYRLRNWETSEALAVLNTAADLDQVPFAEVLKETLVRDLEQAGEVRPVELQLVATQLIDQRIYELDRYRDAKGARGILASYIKEKIEPLGPQTPEIERQIARHLLRSLCSKNMDAKRPTGLSFDELAQQIKATLATNNQANLIQDSEQFENALRGIIERFQAAYLIISEDEQKYNLIHDYIVRSILDATGDIETVEEQADRLLDQYLDEQKRKLSVLIPRRHFRFIVKYATPQRKSDEPAARLIARTRRFRTIRALAVIVAIPIVLTILFPPKIDYEMETFNLTHNRWIISPDRRLAISFTENGRSSLWNLNESWNSKSDIGIPFQTISISPRSGFIVGLTKEGKVYVWRPQDKLTAETKPTMILNPAEQPAAGEDEASPSIKKDEFSWEYLRGWVGFSPNEEWIYVVSQGGKLYMWHPGETLAEHPQPYLDLHKRKEFFNTQPYIVFSPNSKYMAAVNNDGSLYIRRLDMLSRNPAQPDQKVKLGAFSQPARVSFSRNSEWIAFNGDDNDKVYVSNLSGFPNFNFIPVTLKRREASATRDYPFVIHFSPNDEWIVANAYWEDIRVWRIAESASVQPSPIAQTETEGQAQATGIDFSADSRWIAGLAADQALYVWQLDKSQAAKIEPSISKDSNASTFKFSPRGDWIAGSIESGSVYIWKTGASPNILEPVARHDTGQVSFYWCDDNAHIFTAGGSDVYWGEVGKNLSLLIREKSKIFDLANTQGGKDFLVFGENHLSVIKRRLYFWGIPIHTYTWPSFVNTDASSANSDDSDDDA